MKYKNRSRRYARAAHGCGKFLWTILSVKQSSLFSSHYKSSECLEIHCASGSYHVLSLMANLEVVVSINISLYDGFITIFHFCKSFLTMPWPPLTIDAVQRHFLFFEWPSTAKVKLCNWYLMYKYVLTNICEVETFELRTCKRKRTVPLTAVRWCARGFLQVPFSPG